MSNVNIVKFVNTPADQISVEGWFTRYGYSRRIVKRTSGGQFTSNVSLNQLAGK